MHTFGVLKSPCDRLKSGRRRGKTGTKQLRWGNFTTKMVEDCAVEVQHIFCTTNSGLQDNLDGSSCALRPSSRKKMKYISRCLLFSFRATLQHLYSSISFYYFVQFVFSVVSSSWVRGEISLAGQFYFLLEFRKQNKKTKKTREAL